MITDAIERHQINSGIFSTAGLKRIQKDRQRRPPEQKPGSAKKDLESNAHGNSDPESRFSDGENEEDVHLPHKGRDALVKILPYSKKTQSAEVKEHGKRIDVTI